MVDEVIVGNQTVEHAEKLAREVGGKAGTIEEAIDSEPDAVFVSLATELHAEVLHRCIDAGLPIFCEKPIALTLPETASVIEHADRVGNVLQIAFQRRLDPDYLQAYREIKDGSLGTLYSIRITAHDAEPAPEEFIASSGGTYRDLHIHDFDLARWVTGLEVERVYAVGSVRGFGRYAKYDDVEPHTGVGLLDDREAERRTRELFDELGEEVDPKTVVADLSTGYWQLSEIVKALARDARIIIMDEPASSLTQTETESLFELIRKLKAREISIVYISHRMEEIFQVADRVTVLRNGKHVVTEETANLTLEQVIEHIVGEKMEQAFEWEERQVERTGTPLLEVEGLSAEGRFQDVSFSLYPGEILGVAGLMCSGRTEIVRALFGIDKIDASEIRVRGQQVTIRSAQDAMDAGISLVPEDRRLQGLVLDHSVKDNLLLSLLQELQRGGVVDDRRGEQIVESSVERLQVKANSISEPVRLLSGGNQQKVVIAKWLADEPDILIMDEPTAGVDIGSKTEILDIIRRLADADKGIILISSELAELLAVCDRVLVLQDGAVKQEMERSDIDSEEELHHAVRSV